MVSAASLADLVVLCVVAARPGEIGIGSNLRSLLECKANERRKISKVSKWQEVRFLREVRTQQGRHLKGVNNVDATWSHRCKVNPNAYTERRLRSDARK